MPRLYSITNDFDSKNPKFNPSHYFLSASYGSRWPSSVSHWTFDLNKDFPVQSYIHLDNLDQNDTKFWIELRKDTERSYLGDCFYVYDCKNYRRWWNSKAKHEYDRDYDTQKHGYWIFFFEEESDQTMFILKHGEMLSPKCYRFHPTMGVSCIDSRYDVPDDEEILGAWKV